LLSGNIYQKENVSFFARLLGSSVADPDPVLFNNLDPGFGSEMYFVRIREELFFEIYEI
jgi:hypothetical protein